MRYAGVISLLIGSLLVSSCSCNKPAGNSVTGGGKGGNATLRITPEYANYFIDTCTVYIKYGTHDAPANGVYDDSTICVIADTPVAVFNGLTTGLYYLYGVGYHSIGGHPPNVKGSQICTISKEETMRLYMPVYPYIP